jgi:hypothetical protein
MMIDRKKLNELTTKFDSIFSQIESGEDLDKMGLSRDVNSLVDFLESIGGRVNGMEYVSKPESGDKTGGNMKKTYAPARLQIAETVDSDGTEMKIFLANGGEKLHIQMGDPSDNVSIILDSNILDEFMETLREFKSWML